MNKKQQELFVALFEQIFQAQEAFQQIKKKLKKCNHFNPHLLFRHVSMGGQQDRENDPSRISIIRLRNYLTDKITCNQRQLYQLFQKMDIDRLGFISLQNFVRQITPLFQNPGFDTGDGAITPQIQGYFLSLLTEYIKRFRILEISRKQVHFIWPYNAFIEIDNYLTGLIGLGELQRFMNKNDYQINQSQLMFLLHGLRRRHYLQVNLQVFCQNLDPMQFGQYQQYKKSIQQEKERQFLSRSRRQQQTMRRSRIQSWKIDHNIAKEERRKKAEIQRQLQLQQRINKQIKEHEKQKQRLVRRAVLEEDKNIRWNVTTGSKILQAQRQKIFIDKLRNDDLNIIKHQQNDVQNALVRSAYARQQELSNSRRTRYKIQMERQIQEQIQYKKQLERRQYELQRQRILQENIERTKQMQRRQIAIAAQRQRRLAYDVQLQRQNHRLRYINNIQADRRTYQDQLRLQRQRAQRQYELERIRNQELSNLKLTQINSNSRRVNDLQRQLERTRSQIRQRQSRLNLTQSKRQPETAQRQYRTGAGYR